jgi:hypothetical protein
MGPEPTVATGLASLRSRRLRSNPRSSDCVALDFRRAEHRSGDASAGHFDVCSHTALPLRAKRAFVAVDETAASELSDSHEDREPLSHLGVVALERGVLRNPRSSRAVASRNADASTDAVTGSRRGALRDAESAGVLSRTTVWSRWGGGATCMQTWSARKADSIERKEG